jgi:hypothetical protein
MRDNSKALRVAIFTALTGNTGGYNMYDEKRKVSATDSTFILFTTQQQTPDVENDCSWISKCSIDIEIINKTGSEVSKNTIDDISNQILQVLLPSVGVTNLTSANLQFGYAYCESILSRNLSLSETESIMQKVIRFVVQVTEQS